MKQSTDWLTLKSAFVRSDSTLTDFAKMNNLNYKTLSRHAAAERWLDARRDLQAAPPVQNSCSVGALAQRLNHKLCQWVEDPDSVNIADIDKAAGVLKKLQDLSRSDEEEAPVIYLSHQVPRA